MDYLLLPFDKWCQNSVLRHERMLGGSHVEEPYRINHSEPPAALNEGRFKNHAYVHIEYRTPCTWLTHPWLAYSYLALGKLTMLNFSLIKTLALKEKPAKKPKPQQPGLFIPPALPSGNGDNQKIFVDRLSKVIAAGARITTDIEDLETALGKIDKWRERWVQPSTPIMVDSWRKLL